MNFPNLDEKMNEYDGKEFFGSKDGQM